MVRCQVAPPEIEPGRRNDRRASARMHVPREGEHRPAGVTVRSEWPADLGGQSFRVVELPSGELVSEGWNPFGLCWERFPVAPPRVLHAELPMTPDELERLGVPREDWGGLLAALAGVRGGVELRLRRPEPEQHDGPSAPGPAMGGEPGRTAAAGGGPGPGEPSPCLTRGRAGGGMRRRWERWGRRKGITRRAGWADPPLKRAVRSGRGRSTATSREAPASPGTRRSRFPAARTRSTRERPR